MKGLVSFQVFIDGTEVEAKCSQLLGSSGFYGGHVNIELPIQVDSGESTSVADAVFASWTSPKTIKVQCYEYGNSTEIRLFQPYYWENGYVSNATMPVLKPMISIETYGYG